MLFLAAALVLAAGCTDERPSEQAGQNGAAPGATGGSAAAVPETLEMQFADVERATVRGNFRVCGDCHAALDRTAHDGTVLTRAFKHSLHLEKGAECTSCHEVPTHTAEGIRVPKMATCFSCHSQTDEAAPPGECSACHPAEFPLVPASHQNQDWRPIPERVDAVKGLHTAEGPEPEACKLCHAPTFCRSCHKVDMPHPENWLTVHPEPASEVGGRSCNLCHPNRNSCRSCHHPGYTPDGPPWWRLHPQAVGQVGVRVCISCHSTRTCAHCHTTGEYKEFD